MMLASEDPPGAVRFGRFELRRCARRLLADGRDVPLGARAFDVLQALVERRDRIVDKDELLDLAWPGLVVEESNLTVQISVLRKVLGPHVITTVHGRGYRFTAEVARASGRDGPAAVDDRAESMPSSLGTPNNLPRQATSFIGRDDEIAEVDALLAGARITSVVGPGGIGKTRLACEVARRRAGNHPDGVWFVDLAPLAGAESVVRAVARALDVHERPGCALVDAVCTHAATRRLLLVLDNCEHLLDTCRDFADTWLRLTQAPTLLVTSREALGVEGERCYALPALALPDPHGQHDRIEAMSAVRLFVDRAQQVRPQFRLAATHSAALARLCIRLDGIPLALELAAARVVVMSVEQILDRLDDRFRLLTGGSPAALGRQQTLRATIDWSHALLSEGERALHARLAVFAGSFTLEAAQGVCMGGGLDEWEVLDALTSLTRKSMVLFEDRDGRHRFRLLETVRQYALDRLRDSASEAAWLERHLLWYTALAEKTEPELDGPAQQAAFDAMEAEHDNLRGALHHARLAGHVDAGLRLAAALFRFWSVRGHRVEARKSLEGLLAAEPPGQVNAVRAKALNVLGAIAWELGDRQAAALIHGEGLAIQRQLGNRLGIAKSLNNLGNLKLAENDFAAAEALYEESLALNREVGDQKGESSTLSNLGITASERGDTARAKILIAESLRIDRALGARRSVAAKLNNLGVQYELEGDVASARGMYEESLAIRRELGDRAGVAASLGSLGRVACEAGDHLVARALYHESLAIQRDIDDRRGIALSLEGLAAVCVGRREPLRAARLFGAAEHLRAEIGVPIPARKRPRDDAAVARARGLVGSEAAFDEAWRHGSLMELPRAIAYALEPVPAGVHDAAS